MKPELSISNQEENLLAFVKDSNEAVRFQLVRNVDDIYLPDSPEEVNEEKEEKLTFGPTMTHQIYGETEKIFGYKDLKVRLLFSSATLKVHLEMVYSDTVPTEGPQGINPDPVIDPLTKLLGEGQLCQNLDKFKSLFNSAEAEFHPMGEKIAEWKIKEEDEERCFEVYFCSPETPGLKAYHEKLQPFIMFYIDAASYIDADDPNWRYFLLFERYQVDSANRYAICGYSTAYYYYAYPEKIRPRISQMLILPPFQKKGLGIKLLEAIQKHCCIEKVLDITVEDPSDDFMKLRDVLDAKNCMSLKHFQPEVLINGFNQDMVKESNEKFKMGKKQARKVYEIIRLKNTDRSNEKEYKSYRVDVKLRLNLPFEKEERNYAKMKKVLKPEELALASANLMGKEKRFEVLQSRYEELEEYYLKVIERLEKY